MNDLLRAHVTRVGFNLSLTHTQIRALVEMDHSLKARRFIHAPRIRGVPDSFVVAVGGLIRRGLLTHHFDSKAANKRRGDPRPHYTITPAGRQVIALLKEAGLYQEHSDGLVRGKTA